LSENKLKTLPDISTLNRLQALHLNNNELTTLPPLGSLTKLEYLNIEENKNLTTIPDDIKTLPNLKSTIKLSNNIQSGKELKSSFIEGSMSKQGYSFPEGANQFFNDQQTFKFTYAQGSSENEALRTAQEKLKISE
jgi:Leucine-rich repeat (LRR) protein